MMMCSQLANMFRYGHLNKCKFENIRNNGFGQSTVSGNLYGKHAMFIKKVKQKKILLDIII